MIEPKGEEPEEYDWLDEEEEDTYIGTYVPKGIEDDPTGRQPYDLL